MKSNKISSGYLSKPTTWFICFLDHQKYKFENFTEEKIICFLWNSWKIKILAKIEQSLGFQAARVRGKTHNSHQNHLIISRPTRLAARLQRCPIPIESIRVGFSKSIQVSWKSYSVLFIISKRDLRIREGRSMEYIVQKRRVRRNIVVNLVSILFLLKFLEEQKSTFGHNHQCKTEVKSWFSLRYSFCVFFFLNKNL